MNTLEIQKKITNIIKAESDYLAVDSKITTDMKWDDFHMDSLSALNIFTAIEYSFDITIPDCDLPKVLDGTVADTVTYLENFLKDFE